MTSKVLPLILLAHLCAGCAIPFAEVEEDPWEGTGVVGIPADDPDILAAVAQARKNLPTFRTLWSRRKPLDQFIVKKEFRQDLTAEHMWIDVTEMKADQIAGVLQSTPVKLTNVKEGDKVTLTFDEVQDWTVFTEDRTYGSYSEKVLEKNRSE